ncbi:unnamed protein product [Brassica rapa]|uniref:Uncharacterized protein n=2 Tax=Brassica TaxID=3705 RepID=A0A8D9H7E2_BRACM|nr:unnamed protein product [Brassica napus]CAG7894285.1 unnamed protein product [Brassica rapa]
MDTKDKDTGLEKDSNQQEHTSKATGFTLSPSGYKDSWFMPDIVIMDQLVDEDNEIMGKPTDEDVLTIPNGHMTRSRTKKLNEAIGCLLKTASKQEEGLGRGLISQDTLITIQATPPSS